ILSITYIVKDIRVKTVKINFWCECKASVCSDNDFPLGKVRCTTGTIIGDTNSETCNTNIVVVRIAVVDEDSFSSSYIQDNILSSCVEVVGCHWRVIYWIYNN